MKRIDRALLAEAIPALVFGAVLYGVLAITSATLPRLTWLAGASVGALLTWLAAQLPTALAQTLPIALVLATLLTFGRMRADKEILALLGGGVPLVRILVPLLAAGAVATLATLAAYQWVTPRTHAYVASEYWRMTAGSTGLFRLAGRALPVGDFTLAFERTVDGGRAVEDVRLERWDGRRLTLVTADRARFVGTALELRGHRTVVVDLAALDAPAEDAAARLRALVPLDARAANPDDPLEVVLGVDEEALVARYSRGGFEDDRSLSELARDWRGGAPDANARRTAGVTLMRRLAEPFANVVLLLVALPLSLGWVQGRGVAFGVSLVVTLAWYLLSTLGQFAAQTGAVPVAVGPWIANVALGVVGLGLLQRLSRRRAGA
ncbi:MAG: LptF/LptG family permease [Trueperaceae bacterium]|nr:LptF/LptG family permease [Trueperaceae bacterium]